MHLHIHEYTHVYSRICKCISTDIAHPLCAEGESPRPLSPPMITYNTIGIPMPPIDRQAVTTWIGLVAASYGKRPGDINYVFVDDEEILRINRRFIGHDYYTDHIGFDYCQGSILAGDTYISLDTVATNAELFGTDYLHELHRVIIHSILHLCGMDDQTPEQRSAMEEAENRALEMLTASSKGQ